MPSKKPEAADSARRWASLLFLVGACIGVVLVIVGVAWKSFTAPETFWSDEQAKEFAAASDAMHAQTAEAQEHGSSEDADTAAARDRLARIQGELERARYARDDMGPLLTRIGLVAAIAFGVGYLVSRDAT